MAEKKVFRGLFPKHLVSQTCSLDVWKDRIPHTSRKSHNRVESAAGLDFLPTSHVFSLVCKPVCKLSPALQATGGLVEWRCGPGSYMVFMPLAVAPSGSPSPTAATSCKPE